LVDAKIFFTQDRWEALRNEGGGESWRDWQPKNLFTSDLECHGTVAQWRETLREILPPRRRPAELTTNFQSSR